MSRKRAIRGSSIAVKLAASSRHLGRLSIAVLLALCAAGCWGKKSGYEVRQDDPAVSRDGIWLAFSGKDGVYIAPLGKAARRITGPGKNDVFPDWSPDGSRIVFSRFVKGGPYRGLYVVNRDGSGLRQLTRRNDRSPSWSPDGKSIAFARDSDIRLIDADGDNERLLLHGAADPAWSPDGSKIAFRVYGIEVGRGLEDGLAVFDLRTERVKLIRSGDIYAPAWSPDGTQIAFSVGDVVPGNVIGIPEIYVVNADGTQPRRLTTNMEVDASPTWTRGGRIVFASSRQRVVRLYIMNRDGTRVRRLR